MESIYAEIVNIHNLLLSTHPTGTDILIIAEAVATARKLLSNCKYTPGEKCED